jgi:hypothetical protein
LRKPARLSIAVLLMLCTAARMTGQSQAPKPHPQVSYPAIDRFIEDRMERGGIPGLALAITRARDGEPVTPQTRFLIASISKSFTALAVMQLLEAGRLELNAPVRRYLPQFRVNHANAASRITIRHLLNHTSGLADPGFPEGRLPEPSSIAERVATLRTARPTAAPGAEFHYFNPNYAVLARVIEVVNKRPFHDYLRTHVLNMTPLLFLRVNQPLPCGRGSVNVLSRDRKGADAQLFMTLCLAGMPWIVQWSSGRAFSYEELFRSILDLTIWLGLCAVLGLVNVAARIVLWIRMPVARGGVIERH